MIQVIDDVLFYADEYRNRALASPFTEVAGFKGIAPAGEHDWFKGALETWSKLPIRVNHSFFRKSPHMQEEPNFIHNDINEGQYTAILYLNYAHPEQEGTCFWKERETGRCTGPFPGDLGKDLERWELIRKVPMRFNRAVIFDSRLYHSRAIKDNFGSGDGARLIQVIFFDI